MGRLWAKWKGESFSTRLMLGYVLLVLATTLSAGLPAYWLTSNQLEAQSWHQMHGARTTTLALIQAAQAQLEDSLLLFVERPTLRQLSLEERHEELEEYIANFTRRSGIDMLLVCDAAGLPVAGDQTLGNCSPTATTRYTTIEARPVLLTSRALPTTPPNQTASRVVAGLWLDGAFLQKLAATTGVEQGLLAADGTVLATTLATHQATNLAARPVPPPNAASASSLRYTHQIDDTPYFALIAPLSSSDGASELYTQVLLSVEPLQQTKRRAIAILLASTSAIALLGLFLGIVYIQRLTKPLQEITNVAEAMAVGHITASIPAYQAPREIATLARALTASQQSLLATLGERSQARDWLLTLIQSVVEGVITLDAEGRVTFFSQGAETLSGWSSLEAIGQSIDDIFPPANPEDGSFRQVIPAPGQRRRLDIIHRNGEVMALAITGTQLVPPATLTAEPGQPQTALVVRDVSGEELLDQVHTYFLANLTHEFQTPLSPLNASLELLLENAGELSADDLRQLLHPAQLSLLGLQNLVNNLLASSAIEEGRFTLRLRPTNLHQIIVDSLQLVQPLFARRQQIFTLGEATAVAAYPEIQADAARLTLALVNLLTNASKYSPDGATIDLAVNQTDQWLRIAVADRGPGVTQAGQSQLFNRFVRLDTPESDQVSTGLGLFVVKTTVEAHGGRVGIDERPGGGAIFWIEIPRLSQEGQPETNHENPDRRGRPLPIRHPGIYTTPRRLRGRPRL